MSQWPHKLLIAFCLTGLLQCAKKDTQDDKVDFEITPERPIVMNVDFSYDPDPLTSGDEVSASANWFRFGFTVSNQSNAPITIMSLTFEITAVDSGGRALSSKISATSSNWHDGTAVGLGPVLGEVAIGGSLTRAANFYLSGLPKDARNLLYQIKVNVNGWFGTQSVPTDRLSKSYFFTTR